MHVIRLCIGPLSDTFMHSIGYYMHYMVLCILMLFALQASNCLRSEPQQEQVGLISAVKKGKLNKVKACLHQCTDPNSKDAYGTPALHWASFYDKKGDIMKVLLDAGAQIDAKDIDGWISLDWAFKNSNTVVAVKQLLQKAIERKALKILGQNGQTLLHYAVSLNDRENNTIVQQLLTLGLDPNVQNRYGRTPLHVAVENKKIDIRVVKLLLHAGALTNVQDHAGKVPLDYVATTRKDIIVQLLLHTHCAPCCVKTIKNAMY